jgi:hypothetical protein
VSRPQHRQLVVQREVTTRNPNKFDKLADADTSKARAKKWLRLPIGGSPLSSVASRAKRYAPELLR